MLLFKLAVPPLPLSLWITAPAASVSPAVVEEEEAVVTPAPSPYALPVTGAVPVRLNVMGNVRVGTVRPST